MANSLQTSKAELHRINALLASVRSLKEDWGAPSVDQVESTRTLGEVIRGHGNKKSDNIKQVLGNFHWDSETQEFQELVSLSDFEAALLVMKDLCLNDQHDGDRWVCSACTYSNHQDYTLCEMCQTPRICMPRPKLTGWQAKLGLASQLDLLDCENEWIPGRIIDVQEADVSPSGEKRVFIHYLEWDDHWDEWVTLPSKRLAVFGSHEMKYRFPAGFHKSKLWSKSVYSHLPLPKTKKKKKKTSKTSPRKPTQTHATTETTERKTHGPHSSANSKIEKSVSGYEIKQAESRLPEKPQTIYDCLKQQLAEQQGVDHPIPKVVPPTTSPSSSTPTPPPPPPPTHSRPKDLSLQQTKRKSQSQSKPRVQSSNPKVPVPSRASSSSLTDTKTSSLTRPGDVVHERKPDAETGSGCKNSPKVADDLETKSDEWDMCEEFGADILQCGACGNSSSGYEGATMSPSDFLCHSCNEKEIQEGYAIVVPDQKL